MLAGPAARRLAEVPGTGSAAAAPGSAETQASQIASAMLSWTVLLLAPVSVIIAVAAGPLATLLLAGAPRCAHAAIVGVSSRMLVVFAPQILLYGLAVVLYGILQAHRRFTAPALAPVLSSLVVISAYLAFVPLSQGYGLLAALPRPAELMLSVGTTAGVAALVVTALVPALRLRLRLRPTLRFPAGVAPRIRGLAAVGLIALIAQDASVVAVMVLANGQEGQGALVLYNFGWQMFFVPYAVLAVPIATTAFPVLAAAGGARFDDTAAASTRAVMLVSWLGAALLAGAAVPTSRLFTHHPADARQLAYTFAAFAPGLIGYGLSTNLSRVLFADARTRVAAAALVAGWLLVIAADVVAVRLVPDWWVGARPGPGQHDRADRVRPRAARRGAPGAGPGRAARRAARGPGRAGRGGGRGRRRGRAVLRRARPRLRPQRRARDPGLRLRDARVRRERRWRWTEGTCARCWPAAGTCCRDSGWPGGNRRRERARRSQARRPCASATCSPRPPGAPAATSRCWPAAAPPGAPRSTCTAPPGLAGPGSGARPGWDFSVVDIADGPRPARDLAAVPRVRRLLARDTPDVLHAHGLRAGALAALALAGPGPPAHHAGRDGAQRPARPGPAAAVYAGLELIVARRADAVLTVSGDLAARMRRRGARLAGRALVPAPAAPGASPAEIAALRCEVGGPAGRAGNAGTRARGQAGRERDRALGRIVRGPGWPRRKVSAP